MRPAKPVRRPVFLDPDRYRRRRLMDAARLLPVLGAFLILLPVLWLPGSARHDTALEGIYLFAVWAGLIVLARLFAPGLAAVDAGTEGRMLLSMPSANGKADGYADAPPKVQAAEAARPDAAGQSDGTGAG
jgi:hypothetical protein